MEVAALTFDDVRAQCASRGVHLSRSRDEEEQPIFVAHRWGYAREFASLEAVVRFLDWAHPQRAKT